MLRTRISIIILLLACMLGACGQATNHPKETKKTMTSTSDQEQIKALYERMYKAMIAKDETTLNEVHAEDFVLVHMTGMKQSKETYIRSIMNGTLNYYEATTEHLYIDVSGNVATLTGQSKVLAAVFGGGKHTWPLQLRFQLRKDNGNWKFTHSEASTY